MSLCCTICEPVLITGFVTGKAFSMRTFGFDLLGNESQQTRHEQHAEHRARNAARILHSFYETRFLRCFHFLLLQGNPRPGLLAQVYRSLHLDRGEVRLRRCRQMVLGVLLVQVVLHEDCGTSANCDTGDTGQGHGQALRDAAQERTDLSFRSSCRNLGVMNIRCLLMGIGLFDLFGLVASAALGCGGHDVSPSRKVIEILLQRTYTSIIWQKLNSMP